MALAGRRRARRYATRGVYVVGLLDAGVAAVAQKVGEEGVETALAAVADSDERLVEELADLWFHSYVLLARAASIRSGSKRSYGAGTPAEWPPGELPALSFAREIMSCARRSSSPRTAAAAAAGAVTVRLISVRP